MTKSRIEKQSVPKNGKERIIRFENFAGDGLFSTMQFFACEIDSRIKHMPRSKRRDFDSIHYLLHHRTPPAPASAYQDRLSKSPMTWWKTSATWHIRQCRLLMHRFNTYGLGLREITIERPLVTLWEDDLQIVIRALRR